MEEQELNIVVEHYDNDELAAANEALADAYFSFRGEYERVVAENEKMRKLCIDLFCDIDGLVGEEGTTVAENESSLWLLDRSDVERYRNQMRDLGFEVD